MIVDKIQELMGNPDLDMPSIWLRYAKIAGAHAAQQLWADREGYYEGPHATNYCPSYGCKRKSAYKIHKVEGEPFQWRMFNTFGLGYCVELFIKAQITELGIDFEDLRSFPLHWQLDGEPIMCSPDLYNVHLSDDPNYTYVVEIKSAASGSFDKVEREGIRSAYPHYFDQVQLEIAATGAHAGILVMENKNTAHLYEEVIEPDRLRLAELDKFFLDVHSGPPEQFERPFALVERTLYHRGGTPPQTNRPLREKFNKNGATIGWYEVLPEADLPWNCGYCAWKHTCWAPATITNVAKEGEKPIWEVRQ